MTTRLDTAEAIGFALGVVLPDVLRNLPKATNSAELYEIMSAILASHREALHTSPLPLPLRPTYTAFFTGMQKGLDGFGAHHDDGHAG